MKTLTVLFISFLFLGCKTDPKKQAILDYVQTIEGTKVDMKAKVLELRKERDMVALDSAFIIYAKHKQNQELGISNYREAELELDEMGRYVDKDKEKLGEYWFSTYQIKNPLLNDAKQEVPMYFVFVGEKIVGTFTDEEYKAITKTIEEEVQSKKE